MLVEPISLYIAPSALLEKHVVFTAAGESWRKPLAGT